MTPQDHELISQLFTRLKQAPAQPVDAEAADAIQRLAREQPDAAYKLVQTVLIQDMALSQAQARLAELERDNGEAPRASFLPQNPRGSVPAAGPWQRSAPQVMEPQPAPAPVNPPPASSPWGPAAQGGAGGGFLRAAAATAAGVVGGQLLFQGIQSMFGAHAGGILAGQSAQPSLTETVTNNYYYGDPNSDPIPADPDSVDPANDPNTTVADNTDPEPDPSLDDPSDAMTASNDDWDDNTDLA